MKSLKYLKTTWSFSSIFWALNLIWKILKNLQMFKRCFTPCLFLSVKNLKWYYFIFSPASVIENVKMLKLPMFNHFPSCILFQDKILDCRKKIIKIVLLSDNKIRPGKTSFYQYLLWKAKTTTKYYQGSFSFLST